MSLRCPEKLHRFRQGKCVFCPATEEQVKKAKELDLKTLRFDEPTLKKRKKPFKSEINWRDLRDNTYLNQFTGLTQEQKPQE